jgi:WD40 repeat protein
MSRRRFGTGIWSLAAGAQSSCAGSGGRFRLGTVDSKLGSQVEVLSERWKIIWTEWSPDDRYLAVLAADSLSMWDVASQRPVWRIRSYSGYNVIRVQFHPDGRSLVVPAKAVSMEVPDNLLSFIDVESGSIQRSLTIPNGGPRSRGVPDFGLSADGSRLALIVGGTGLSAVFDLRDGSYREVGPTHDRLGKVQPPRRILFDYQANQLLLNGITRANTRLGATFGDIQVWDITTNRVIRVFDTNAVVDGPLVFDASSRRLIRHELFGPNTSLPIWNVDTGRLAARLDRPDGNWGRATSLALSADHRWLVATRMARFIQSAPMGRELADGLEVWDIASTRLIGSMKGPFEGNGDAKFSNGGRYLAYATNTNIQIIELNPQLGR